MKISRLSFLTLGLVIAAFSFGYMNPSLAGKPDANGCHDHKEGDCGVDPPSEPGGGKAEFSVSGQIGNLIAASQSDPEHHWRKTSKHGIGESDPHSDKLALVNFDGAYFSDGTVGEDNCFGASMTVREASIRERRGAIESMFWFHGKTELGGDVVAYILHMDGTTVGDFPPDDAPLQVEMDQWRINVANGQSDVEPDACAGSSGSFVTPVLITVTPEL